MKKIFLSMGVAIVSSLTAGTANADCIYKNNGQIKECIQWSDSGTCGKGCTYTYENGTVYITAIGNDARIDNLRFSRAAHEGDSFSVDVQHFVIDGNIGLGSLCFYPSGATVSGKDGVLVLTEIGHHSFSSTLLGQIVIPEDVDIPNLAFYQASLGEGAKIYCAVENCAQKIIDSCSYSATSVANDCLDTVNSFISDPDKFEQAPAGCAMYSASGCSNCSTGYHDESGMCVMNTCDYISELSVCEDSIEGCTRQACAAGTTLADGTSCYVKTPQDITPTCGANAHVVESENTCSCVCDSGYSGDGTECTMLTCAEVYQNSTDTCENSVSGCSVTTCTEVGTLVDGETKCYTSATVDHTQSCGSNASVVGTGTECSCQCNSGYSGDGTTCTMLTCEDLGKMSSCSDSIVGCEKTTCSEDGTLADSSVCYTATVEDITPSCDTHASLNQQSCSCLCNEGYEGDGETCQAISCSAGQYLDGSECKQCAAGSYAAAGDNHCSACADGAYSAAGAGSCSPRQNTDNCSEFAVDSDTCTGCNSGYHVNNGACLLTCPDEQVLYKGECLDEYPFAKKHYTPAEANVWLKDDDNTITLLFKK